MRPHTPVSTNATVGAFELMVKVYGVLDYGGGLSAHRDVLLGATVDFKHIPFNGSKTEADILARETFDAWAAT